MPSNARRPVALIGYRGAGKSVVAQHLALLLGCDWVDADVEVELRAGKSIAAMFRDDGEHAFRDLEAEVVAQLCQREHVILALGGGAVLRQENRQALAACQAVVWLKASAETIAGRLAQDPASADRRPNLTNSGGRPEIERLLAERTPIYRQCATLAVDTDGRAPADIAAHIAGALGPGP